MQTLTFLKHQSELQVLFFKISNTLEEIKIKHPNREDYIKSMTESLIKLGNALEFYRDVEKEYRIQSSRNYDLELINLNLITDNKKLQQTINNLTDKINL